MLVNNLFLLKSVGINFIFTITTSILGFFLNRYFVVYLGINYLGVIKLFTEILAYLSIVDMGIGSAAAYGLYKPLAEKNYEKINIVFSTLKSIYIKISMFILIFGVVITFFLDFFIKDIVITNEIKIYWLLMVSNTAITYLFGKYITLFNSDQKFNFVKIVQGSTRIVSFLFQIILLIRFQSFLGIGILIVLESIFQYVIYSIYYRKKYSYINITKARDKTIFKNLKNLFYHKLAGLVVFNTDLILISKYVSIEIVGIYASYQMVYRMIMVLIGILIGVISPITGRYIASHSKKDIFKLFNLLNTLFIILAIISSYLFYNLISSFIGIWLGEKYILSQGTSFLITINLFIGISRQILEIFKENSGFFDDIYNPIMEAVINFVFSIILVKFYGLNGVIIGTIISNLIVVMGIKPIMTFNRAFDKGIIDYIKIYGKNLILIFFTFFIGNFLKKYFIIKILNINTWILQGIILTLLILFVTVIVFLIDKDFRKILKEKRWEK